MNHTKAVLYGFLVWAIPFVVAMLVFPLRTPERALFESIMPVSITFSTILASYLYLKNVNKRYFMIGLCLGIIWAVVSLVIDGLMFSWGPMKMSLADYIKDIGVTYLIVLLIPTGMGLLLEKKLS